MTKEELNKQYNAPLLDDTSVDEQATQPETFTTDDAEGEYREAKP